MISTVEHADNVLRAHVGEADTIKVVVPVVREGVLDWLANDQKDFPEAAWRPSSLSKTHLGAAHAEEEVA